MYRKHLTKGIVGATALALTLSTFGLSDQTPAREEARPSAHSFRALTDQQLWEPIKESEQTAVVGLKEANKSSGFAEGKSLLHPEQRRRASEAVLSGAGVSFVSSNDIRPTMTVKLADLAALQAVRRSPFVEWVEPSSFKGQLASDPSGNMGCNGNGRNESPAGGDVYTGPYDRDDSTGDKLPINFRAAKVREAWALGVTGAGATVGVVDTGTFPEQTQLTESGPHRRVVLVDAQNPATDWADKCNHGTRMSSTIAAPRDGISMAGVAPRANLVAVKANDDVVVVFWETERYANAIRQAVVNGARIGGMAFGTASWEFDNIKQEILMHVGNGVLFVAAAGTGYCDEGVVFPAKMPEVFAVTATVGNQLAPNVCLGPEVDLHADVGQTFALGKLLGHRPGSLGCPPDGPVCPGLTWGGSSAATAVVSGVAALVWSKYPQFTAEEVKRRLIGTATRGSCSNCGGSNGRVNAYAAVGGFEQLGVGGPRSVTPGSSYTLTAAPSGDGPFTYYWSTGATTPSITWTAGAAGTSQTFTLWVTNTQENKTLSQSVTVSAQSTTTTRRRLNDCTPTYCP